MNIAFIAPEIHKHGGTEKASAYLLEELSKMHNVHLYTIRCTEIDISRMKVYHIPCPIRPVLISHILFFIISSIVIAIRKMFIHYDIIASHGPDNIFANVITLQFCHKKRLELVKKGMMKMPLSKYVAAEHSSAYAKLCFAATNYKQFLRKFYYFIYYRYTAMFEKMFYKMKRNKIRKAIAVSNGIKNEFIKYKLLPEDKIVVIPNFIDEEIFNYNNHDLYRNEIRRKFGISNDEFVILFVSRGEFHRKGLFLLIDGVRMLRENITNITLLIVGGKEGVESYKRMYSSLKYIIFTGIVDDVYKYYHAGDVFVFPSYYEAFALVLLEAAACGIPIISSCVNGAEELIYDGKNGFFINYDPADIAEKISIIYKNNKLRESMREYNLKIIQNFTKEKILSNIIDVYKECSK
jgi:glycosyltransferase involved in cell wall biosynthesis